jgi:hypothetical protein
MAREMTEQAKEEINQPTERWVLARIRRIYERLERENTWIKFSAIADYLARESGSIIPDEKKRRLTYDSLEKDFLDGKFEAEGRSQVLLLHPGRARVRIGRLEMSEIISNNYDGQWGRLMYLPHCWGRREMVDRWFDINRLAKPPFLSTRHSEVDAAEITNAGPKRHKGESLPVQLGRVLRQKYGIERPIKKVKALMEDFFSDPSVERVGDRTFERALASAWPKDGSAAR